MRGAVVLAELRKGRPHVAQHFTIMGLGVEARGTAAEELVARQQLLVHFEAGDEADRFVVEGLEHQVLFLGQR
jgi:hypothetical protein